MLYFQVTHLKDLGTATANIIAVRRLYICEEMKSKCDFCVYGSNHSCVGWFNGTTELLASQK